jgi:hypothetical protein
MTEAEWLACTDPQPMLGFLRGKARERKLRLFACGCSRRIVGLLPMPLVLDIAERFADGLTDADELAAARRAAQRVFPRPPNQVASQVPPLTGWQVMAGLSTHHAISPDAARVVHEVARAAAVALGERGRAEGRPASQQQAVGEAERAAQADLLRDIFGNPWRPATVPAPVLAWDGGTVRRLAEAVYAERQMPAGTLNPARLAVLADALEEAGCADEAVLSHLRSEGHTFGGVGCWTCCSGSREGAAVTEAEWNGCTDSFSLLRFLTGTGKASGRKLRLFACACARDLLAHNPDEHCHSVFRGKEGFGAGILRAEAVAEGKVPPPPQHSITAIWVELPNAPDAALVVFGWDFDTDMYRRKPAGAAKDFLVDPGVWLRDIFGPLLFRQVPFDPVWLTWNGGAVKELAEAAYAERALPAGTLEGHRLAVLAGALEEAGCASEELLLHCRKQGSVHVRGCWAIDLILGKS